MGRLFVAAMVLLTACEGGGAVSDGGGADGTLPDAHSTAPPIFVEAQFAVRCDETSRYCTPEMADICGFYEGGVARFCVPAPIAPAIGCTATPDGAGGYTVGFIMSDDRGVGFEVDGMHFVAGGGPVESGRGCLTQFLVGSGPYVGPCGGDGPTADQPCRIDNVQLTNDAGNPTLTADIYCVGLPSIGSPSVVVDITAAGTSSAAATIPGHVRIANCPGLAVP